MAVRWVFLLLTLAASASAAPEDWIEVRICSLQIVLFAAGRVCCTQLNGETVGAVCKHGPMCIAKAAMQSGFAGDGQPRHRAQHTPRLSMHQPPRPVTHAHKLDQMSLLQACQNVVRCIKGVCFRSNHNLILVPSTWSQPLHRSRRPQKLHMCASKLCSMSLPDYVLAMTAADLATYPQACL